MGTVTESGDSGVSGWAERNNEQASRLLKILMAAKPLGSPSIGGMSPVGGDHPKPRGLFVELLFGPGEFVWPVDSEAQLANDAEVLGQQEKFHEGAAEEAGRYANQVFSNYWTAGAGAEAAEAAHRRTQAARLQEASACGVAKRVVAQVAVDVERTKRYMTQESDAAHVEIEAFLRSGSGQSIAQVGAIVAKYRGIIQAQSADLHAHVASDTVAFTNQFPLSPSGYPKPLAPGTDPSTDPAPDPPANGVDKGKGLGRGQHDASSGSPSDVLGPPKLAQSTDAVPSVPPSIVPGQGLPSLLGSGSGLSGLPSVPTGGGASGLPVSGLQGLMGFGGLPGGGAVPAGLSSSALQVPSTPPAAGLDFGRGLAAGVTAVGGVTPVASVPQAPVTPLVAPGNSASAAAVPAVAPVSTSLPAAPSVPTSAAGLPAGGGLSSYGSVLPPTAPSMPASGAIPPPPAIPAEAGGGGPAPAGAGLVPVTTRREAPSVARGVAETDLELARRAVGELAAAASVEDPGLDWAVALGHNGSGRATLWVATNDGACYIPPGVYLHNAMSVAAGFDEDFDERWLGWANPAEKVVRAARAYGDAVGAVATTWAWPSEFLDDSHDGVREIAIGVSVPHGAPDNPAAELLRSRAHRLQTIDVALYADLKTVGEFAVGDYCREVTRRVVFGGSGVELSPVAQAVAHALVADRWPKPEEWAALGAEYESARLMMGAQRPGLNGLEDPDQLISYRKLYVNCCRLETLVCWKRSGQELADVVYAARMAGVRVSLMQCT